MLRYTLLLTLSVGAVMLAVAQPDPNVPQTPVAPQPQAIKLPMSRPDAMNTALVLTQDGLFILHGGILAKFDPKTLKGEGTLTLIEQPTITPMVFGGPGPVMQPMALQGGGGAAMNIMVNGVAITAPAGGAAAPNIIIAPGQPGAVAPTQPANLLQNQTAQQRWNAAPALMDAGDALVAVQYDKVFCVDPKALTLAASCDLPLTNNAAGGFLYYIVSNQQTVTTLDNGTLYITRGTDLWSVDVAGMKLLGHVTLPQPAGTQPGTAPPIRLQPTTQGTALLNQAGVLLDQLQQQVAGGAAPDVGQVIQALQAPIIQ